MLERRKAFEEQREAAKQVERIAPLTRLGTPLTVGAPPARNVAELKPILGNDNATPKTKPKVTALPLRRRAFASQDDVAARNPDTVTLEHAKPVSRVSLDILLSNPVPVQASALSGHIKIRIRKSSAIAKEEPVAVAGEGKVRVVGFGSVAHNGAEEKFVFYQAGGRLKFQTGSVWKEGETGDAEGFGLAREGAHVLPFRLSLPLAGSDGDAKGPSNVHRGVLVRYITMASIKIKDLRTSKRSIAHFYRTVFIYPRLDSLLLGTSASRLRNGAHRALEASHHFTVQVYRSASSLPSSVWEAFQSSPQDSNIMYPHALKRLIAERNGQPALDDELWIAYWSNQPTPTIDFVLSCTNGPLGTYPVFLFTPHAFTSLTEEFLLPRLAPLVDKLRQEVPTQRVFSVFAPEPVSNVFAKLWTRHTGIQTENEPYYAALISYCTRETFTNRQISSAPDFIYETRLAVASDIPGAARLCWGFASESEPFVLTPERALEEAKLLIRNRQLWILLVGRDGDTKSEIASITAVTRTCSSAATITKVYTSPDWRSNGCAERLVRFVCKHHLRKKKNIVLFVAHDNPAASKVYDRVGFVGLNQHNRGAEGVDPWLEIGFNRSSVQLGHW